MVEPPWYTTAFGHGYRLVYPHRDAREATADVAGAARWLALGPGTRVLDCGCGFGRHLAALRACGCRAVGVDLSVPLLRDARDAGPVVRGDLARLPFGAGSPTSPRFDVAVAFFTTFGYGADDADDVRWLREAARVLRPGGTLLLDLPNPAAVRATLRPESDVRCGEVRVHERRTLVDDRMEKDVELRHPDGRVETWHERVRLYEPERLPALVAQAGFVVTALASDPGGTRFHPDAPRCVARCARDGRP